MRAHRKKKKKKKKKKTKKKKKKNDRGETPTPRRRFFEHLVRSTRRFAASLVSATRGSGCAEPASLSPRPGRRRTRCSCCLARCRAPPFVTDSGSREAHGRPRSHQLDRTTRAIPHAETVCHARPVAVRGTGLGGRSVELDTCDELGPAAARYVERPGSESGPLSDGFGSAACRICLRDCWYDRVDRHADAYKRLRSAVRARPREALAAVASGRREPSGCDLDRRCRLPPALSASRAAFGAQALPETPVRREARLRALGPGRARRGWVRPAGSRRRVP
jgi:hypothetical protein